MESSTASPAPAATGAPAASSTPATMPATHAAVVSGNPSEYRTARRAERQGTPLPAVPVTPAPTSEAHAEATAPAADGQPPAATAAPAETRKQREDRLQQETNERVRKAVETATADLRAEVARLRTAAPPAAETKPAEPKAAEYKRFLDMPDAPKLEHFDSVGEHTAAMALFINQTLHAERLAADRQSTDRSSAEAHQRELVTTFDGRVSELAKTDPDILAKIVPVAEALGKAGGPSRIVADLALASELGPQVLRHFKEHPEALTELITLPPTLRGLPLQRQIAAHIPLILKAFGRLEATLETASIPAAPAAPAPRTLTRAPAPAATLGRRPAEAADPKAAAIRSGDTRAYRELRRHERAARLGR